MWLVPDKRNVPAIRFLEYTEDYARTTLGKIGNTYNGLTGKSAEDFGQGSPYITYKSIFDNSRVDISRVEYVQISDIEQHNKKQNKVARGDIFFTTSSETPEEVGMTSVLLDNIEDCYLNSFCFGYRVYSQEQYLPEYLRFYLRSSIIRKKLFVLAQGSTRFNLSKNEVMRISINMPKALEQRKIARFLTLLEERITTQNKIIEKLETLIKGITDVLLDNPLWEKVFLHSFMQFYPSNSLSWEQLSYEDGKIRNLHYGLIHNFSTKGITANSLPMILPHNEPKQFTLCKVGDVAFADASEDTNEIGKAVEFISVHPSGTVCGLHTIHGRDIKNKTFVGFKGFAFNSRYFHDQIKRLAQGSKVFSITASNLLSCYIYIPNIAKQEMITKLLHAYEEKIMANKTLLDKYEMQRAYLLQRMFI